MENYVEIAYQIQEKPFGEYPLQLAQYLVEKYGIVPGMKLLDNGCGRGEFLHAFSKCGLDVSGTDISDYCKDSVVVNLEKEPLPFEDNSFDVVFSKSVIEHIWEVEHYMKEMKRVLKEGGRLIIMVPDWETQYRIFYQDPTHIHPYTYKSVNELLLMMGYKDVISERFTQLPNVWKNSLLQGVSTLIRKICGPVKKIHKNKFYRFSRELMILGSGVK